MRAIIWGAHMAVSIEQVRKLASEESSNIPLLEEALAALPSFIDGATQVLDALVADREPLLLRGSDNEVEKLDAEIASARRGIDRLNVVRDKIGSLLHAAREKEASEEADRRREALVARRDELVRKYNQRYPKLAAELLGFNREFEEVDGDIDAFNRAMGGDLRGAESLARGFTVYPHEVVESEDLGMVWCSKQTGDPVDMTGLTLVEMVSEKVGLFQRGRVEGSAQLGLRPNNQGSIQLTLRHLQRVRSKRMQSVRAEKFASALRLPAFKAGCPDIWQGSDERSSVLVALERVSISHVDNRAIETRYVEVIDESPSEVDSDDSDLPSEAAE